MISATTPTATTPAVSLGNAAMPSCPSAPIRPAAGRVRIHATAMPRTTLQWILPPALPSPAPMMPPDTTWVVESEKPKYEDARIVAEELLSEE